MGEGPITTTVENLTNPGIDPVEGDRVRITRIQGDTVLSVEEKWLMPE